MAPVFASRANMLSPVPSADPTYTTPLAADTNPGFLEPCGSGVCQRIAPVIASTPDQNPLATVWPANGPFPLSVNGLLFVLASDVKINRPSAAVPNSIPP